MFTQNTLEGEAAEQETCYGSDDESVEQTVSLEVGHALVLCFDYQLTVRCSSGIGEQTGGKDLGRGQNVVQDGGKGGDN